MKSDTGQPKKPPLPFQNQGFGQFGCFSQLALCLAENGGGFNPAYALMLDIESLWWLQTRVSIKQLRGTSMEVLARHKSPFPLLPSLEPCMKGTAIVRPPDLFFGTRTRPNMVRSEPSGQRVFRSFGGKVPWRPSRLQTSEPTQSRREL